MSSPEIRAACVHNGVLNVCWDTEFKTSSGFVWYQDPVASADPVTTNRPQLWQASPWIQLAGMIGPQRTRVLWMIGTFPAGAVLGIFYDFTEVLIEEKTGFGTGVANQIVEVRLPRQDCHAVRFTLFAHTRLVAWRIEAEVEKGTYRRTAARV